MAIVKQLKQTTCTLRNYLTWYCGYCAVSDKYLMQLSEECCLLDAMKLDKPTLHSLLGKEVTITDIPNYMSMSGSHAVHIKGDGIEFFIDAMDNAFENVSYNEIGTHFDLDECEKAYKFGGVNISWLNYTYPKPTCEDGMWDMDKYYADFDKWWKSLPREEQKRICIKINTEYGTD